MNIFKAKISYTTRILIIFISFSFFIIQYSCDGIWYDDKHHHPEAHQIIFQVINEFRRDPKAFLNKYVVKDSDEATCFRAGPINNNNIRRQIHTEYLNFQTRFKNGYDLIMNDYNLTDDDVESIVDGHYRKSLEKFYIVNSYNNQDKDDAIKTLINANTSESITTKLLQLVLAIARIKAKRSLNQFKYSKDLEKVATKWANFLNERNFLDHYLKDTENTGPTNRCFNLFGVDINSPKCHKGGISENIAYLNLPDEQSVKDGINYISKDNSFNCEDDSNIECYRKIAIHSLVKFVVDCGDNNVNGFRGHLQTLLSEDLSHIGIGLAKGSKYGNGNIYTIAQVFGSKIK